MILSLQKELHADRACIEPMFVTKGVSTVATRFPWESESGEIEEGAILLHSLGSALLSVWRSGKYEHYDLSHYFGRLRSEHR